MNKNIIELTPQELNSFLMDKYGFGLHPFALILYHHSAYRDDLFPSKRKCLELKKKFQNLKNKIIDVIGDYEAFISDVDIKKWYEIDKERKVKTFFMAALKAYKLDSFFNIIDETIDEIDRFIKLKNPGPPIKPINLIASSYALLMQENNYKKEWEFIADIIDWFPENFKLYDCFNHISPKGKNADPEYLRLQFSRNKQRKIWEYNFLKESWRVKNWNKLNITIIFYDYLSYFMRHSTLQKKYIEILSREEKDIQIIEALLAKRIKDPQNMPFHFTKYALEYYVAKIYKINPKSPPLIVFPDLSYLQ
ncbi:MAG: hypothetical protein AMJ89_02640 [candidate division Zixibacteria bacterium SM23_73]|nr:MAG: hypothetical protein AMJ89_02640 [candidate division Zixibacteria bacterium SM23_73]